MQAVEHNDQHVHACVGLRPRTVCAQGLGDVPGQGVLHHTGNAGAVSADGLHAAEVEDDSLRGGEGEAAPSLIARRFLLGQDQYQSDCRSGASGTFVTGCHPGEALMRHF